MVARMQQHLATFDFALSHSDFSVAKLKALQMNIDLEMDKQVLIGHGIDKATLLSDVKDKHEAIAHARLLDPDCRLCQNSSAVMDIHPPPEIYNAKDKTNRVSIEMQWLTEFVLKVEERIRDVGYKKGWWNE